MGDHFGRVTEQSLFYTEIQTREGNLTTLSNLHLVTQPVAVTHSSRSMVSSEISLGYDLSHLLIEKI